MFGPEAAVVVFGLFILIALSAWLIPKEKPKRPPDMTAEFYDRRRP